MGLSASILNAPMGGVAGGMLASAVSAAGGLAMIGVGSTGSVELLKREVEYPREASLPFGIGLLDWTVVRQPALLDAAVAAGPRLISVNFGDDWAWTRRVRDAGIVTVAQVFDVAMARRAADSGIDLLVARGPKGAATEKLKWARFRYLKESSMRFLSRFTPPAESPRPGVWPPCSPRGPRSMDRHCVRRDAMVRASETDTVTTRVFDIALGHEWPSRFEERALRNDFFEDWSGREEALAADVGARAALNAAIAADN